MDRFGVFLSGIEVLPAKNKSDSAERKAENRCAEKAEEDRLSDIAGHRRMSVRFVAGNADNAQQTGFGGFSADIQRISAFHAGAERHEEDQDPLGKTLNIFADFGGGFVFCGKRMQRGKSISCRSRHVQRCSP